MFKLNMGTRGRMIDDTSTFNPRFNELCRRCLAQSQAVDPTMPDMEPTTLLINFYRRGATMKWHQDTEHPSRSHGAGLASGKPVISFSIGFEADFGYKRRYDDDKHTTIRLVSGDVLLFGGYSRMIVHGVTNVLPGTMPPHLRGLMREGRLNLTFRDTADGIVDTSLFPRYRVTYPAPEEWEREQALLAKKQKRAESKVP